MPAPPTDAPTTLVLQQWQGLKNTVGVERLAPSELEVARNVDIDDMGQVRRRQGYEQVVAGRHHSLFQTAAGEVLVVRAGVLGVLAHDFSFTPCQSGIGDDPLAYVQVAQTVFYSSRAVSGKLDLGSRVVSAWGAGDEWLSPVINPTAGLPAIRGKLLGAPPNATTLTYWNGRIYLAQGSTLWATELYAYDYVDKTKSFKQFESPIMVVGAVTDGLYVGTETDVWFLTGTLHEMRRLPIQSYGAVPGSLVSVPADLVNPQVPMDQHSPSKNAVMFLTSVGVVAGFDGGNLINLTGTDVIFPAAVSSAATFRRERGVNQYLGVMESGGTPTAATRLGDYADAEIRRAGVWRECRGSVHLGDEVDAEVTHP